MEVKNVKKLTVFISCPGDLSDERQIVEQAIIDYSKQYANSEVTFEAFHFGNVASEFGDTPQNIVYSQLPKFDIYIGMMGNWFGSSTGRYGSGTEDEFRDALERKKANPEIRVSFIFREQNGLVKEFSIAQMEQALKVKQFQSSISSLGSYQTFDSNSTLVNQIRGILSQEADKYSQAKALDGIQLEMLAEVPSHDAFGINIDFYTSVLNSIGAELTNNSKARITLQDVYVPLDLDHDSPSEEAGDLIDLGKVNTSDIDGYANQAETKLIISGDENSGKSALCKRLFMNFHQKGIVPVLINGASLKNASSDNALKIIHQAFLTQYSADALTRYKALPKHKKLLLIDDYDEAKINYKHKLLLLSELENFFGHIFVTTEPLFLFNANFSATEEFTSISHFESFKLRDIGYTLRDELVRKWITAGRQDQISDEEIYSTAQRYNRIIDSVLGANFVPKKPFVVLVLLQAIQGGSSNDLSHSSFVRYYKFLIDKLLLEQAPQSKIEIYYAFLPEIAFTIFGHDKHEISESSFSELIKNFAERRGIDGEDLNNVRNNLLSLEMLIKDGDGFRFKHNYTYYYFLGQYFSSHMSDMNTRNQVSEICKNLNIKENANIIVFLSYHTNDPLVIDSISQTVDNLFKGREQFSFSVDSAKAINQMVTEGPKIIVSNESAAERAKIIEKHDQGSGGQLVTDEDINKEELEALDFVAQFNLAFRSIEIIGQLLKSHYAVLDAGPKKDLFLKATDVSLRSLGVLIEIISQDPESLSEFVKQIDPNIENEKDARKAIFSLAYMFIFNVIKGTSKFTGAENLSKTYKDALDVRSDSIHKIIDLSIKLDCFDDFPMRELKNLAAECSKNHLALATVQSLVKHRLYMRPVGEFKQKQQICSAVGMPLTSQLQLEKKAKA